MVVVARILVVQEMEAELVVMPDAEIFEIWGGADAAQVVPDADTVYTVDPVDWERRALSMPREQERVTDPPEEEVATERS